MGTADSPTCSPDKEEEPPPNQKVEAEPFSSVRLLDAPILLLVYFHKALREELAGLYRLAVLALESGSQEQRELVLELQRRFEFLKLAYKYHCVTEDEVIFVALDVHIKNVACTYSLEHKSIDGLFDSIFCYLSALVDNDEIALAPFQELVSCISTMWSSICEHMLKEEEQVFPLLIKQFSTKEQASLMWQFICSIPVILLEDLLPWLASFLCVEKQVEVMHCIREILPQEKSLQQVVISWLHKNDQSSSGAFTKFWKEVPDGSIYSKNITQSHSFKWPLGENWLGKTAFNVQTKMGNNLVNCLHLWHGAIQKDLKEILEESYQMRNSSSLLDIDSLVVRLKFLADVIAFYSIALKKFFYSVLDELSNSKLSPSFSGHSPFETCIDSLLQLLHSNAQKDLSLCKFLERLCQELESLVIDISKQFHFQEMEVIPVISKNCSLETQQNILHMSLRMMPLGLLKCVVTWFTAYLSENGSQSILHNIKQGDILVEKSFASLLLECFHTGYSGKTTTENFGKDLEKIFKSRCSFLPQEIKEAVGCSSLHSIMQPSHASSNLSKTESDAVNKDEKFSSIITLKSTMSETSYSSEINFHIFFPRTMRMLHQPPKLPGEKSSAISVVGEPIPMDLMFFFHKALNKDMEHLVFVSTQLAENFKLLVEFRQQFHLLHNRYQFHSDSEDEVAFPALEAKRSVQNISHSYAIDHKLEVKYFSEIAFILDKMSRLQASVSGADSNMEDITMMKHNRLCMKLHHKCKSLHKLLFDHVQREEVELWPLFREYFSIKEQEKIIGNMLGRTRAETLKDLIPWLLGSLTPDEQCVMMSLWRKVTKNTMFDEWLGEWWKKYDTATVTAEVKTLCTAGPLEIISKYLSIEAFDKHAAINCDKGINVSRKDTFDSSTEISGKCNLDDKAKSVNGDEKNKRYSECVKLTSEDDRKRSTDEMADITKKKEKSCQPCQLTPQSGNHKHLLTISQDDLEAAIRRVSRDSSLDPQEKSHIFQNLLMSHWIVGQQTFHTEETTERNSEEMPGQHLSYRDHLNLTLGCKHYRRNCKLITPCCNRIYTCIRCHDEEADHSTDRRAITKMMCMKCLVIQPIRQTCSTISCNNVSMARYYCRICKLFDEEREIYHCPYCNLCRLGKGLGIDYFHCMNCNACMSRSLSEHICREKCLEDNCPICHEYIFTSSTPVKALRCGHLMHSTCFQEYTCMHYTCPICSKSLGDMQVYFKMLDALLAEERIPDEYSGRNQAILCNDCEKKGSAPFHWLYHKCSYCGSYNTRLL